MLASASALVVVPEGRAALSRSLVELVNAYAKEAKSKRTRAAYAYQWKSFIAWCEENERMPLPAAPETVAAYLADRAGEWKPASISQALAAISQAHKLAGHESPRSSSLVLETFKGIRNAHGVAPKQKTALLADQVRAIAKALPETTVGLRDRALLLVGFAGGFRRSELVAIDYTHLTFTADGLVVLLSRSKTDQEGEGREVPVPYGRSAATCPVRATKAWLKHAGINEGPVFRAVRRDGSVREQQLSGAAVAAILKRRVRDAGLDPAKFSGHSLRAGFVTSAARAGASASSIMASTGHTTLTMVSRYIRKATLFEDCAAEGLL